MKPSFADIALPVPVNRTFTYLIPHDFESSASIGKRALVQFGRKQLAGIITGMPQTTDIRNLKPIIDIPDDKPVFSAGLLSLTKWMAEYYMAPWGEVLKAAMPQGLTMKSKKTVRLTAEDVSSVLQRTGKKRSIRDIILQALISGKPVGISQLQKRTGVKNIYAVLNEMKKMNWISVEEKFAGSTTRPMLRKYLNISEKGNNSLASSQKGNDLNSAQLSNLKKVHEEVLSEKGPIDLHSFLKRTGLSLSSVNTMLKKGVLEVTSREVIRDSDYGEISPPPEIRLNTDQQSALGEIISAVSSAGYQAFVLHGVTGSGKTQVYIEAIRHVISTGKTAIVLVPEISLTPQTVRRFKSHFGSEVSVMHSQMSTGERYDAWRMAQAGKIKIMIGPRSAVFAPLEKLGLIVVDEEHDSSYKQFDTVPRYNARDVALVRAMQAGAVAILGSATPSVESYSNITERKYRLLELPKRIDTAKLPDIKIINMAEERHEVYRELKEEVKKGGREFPKRIQYPSVSRLLRSEITGRLARKEGIILLQNRRGYSHVMECYDCGNVEKCDNCEVTLTYHKTKKHLRCHYCGSVKPPPGICPKCGGTELRLHAFGTQQIEDELHEYFPDAGIMRMDRDTTSRKGSHDRILRAFGSGRADILLGTQMVAKGLDFPRVTLVGVISADTQILLPDFRASESTFQLLTQVAGRAGRSTLAGEVIIQTLQPEHYSLKFAAAHDFSGFYRQELEYRRELDYPPFSRLILLEFSGENEKEVQHHANIFRACLDKYNVGRRFIILGPADAAIPKIKNSYRKHVLIKNLKTADPSGSNIRFAILKSKSDYESSFLPSAKRVRLSIDVDPQGMM